MKINCIVDKDGYMPVKAHDADAGFDLKCPETKNRYICVPARNSIKLDLKVRFEIPKGYVGFIKSKSGLNSKGLTCEGVIDSGYTGTIKLLMYNHENTDYWFKSGDKVTQIVFLPIPEVELSIVDTFEETERGENGLGSTGI